MKTLQETLSWVKEQNWYPSFKIQFENRKEVQLYKDTVEFHFDLYYQLNRPENAILGAFQWDKSPEGYEYWEAISISFENFLERNM